MFYSNKDGKFWLNSSVYHSHNPWAFKKKVRTYCHLEMKIASTLFQDGFGGPVVSILATGTRVRGFKPGQSRWIFRASRSKIIGPTSQLCGM